MTAAKRARQKAGRAAGGRHTHAVHQKAPGEHGRLVNVRCPVCRPLPMDGEARELARRR